MENPHKSAEIIRKYPQIRYKTLGKTKFSVSVCGFGSYRIDTGIKSHRKALTKALLSGINLIDTSSNYSDGGSEKLIGSVVNELISGKLLLRDELILVSKGGYIQGQNYQLASEKESKGTPFPEVTKCAPDLWHCIHPEFLEDQISKSLDRLNLDWIDVYLLHNPEYFLTYSLISDQERREKEYYRRIEQAFLHLEQEVLRGRIKYYGISSNTFGIPSDKSNHTSIEKVIEITNKISIDNHFAVVQFPMNLFEQGGMLNKNQSEGAKSFLQIAQENNLGVLVNRPLNAIVKNKLIRLADFPVTEDRSEAEINMLIEDLANQEIKLRETYLTFINVSATERKKLVDCLSIASLLESNLKNFSNPGDFKEIKGYHLVPRANFAIDRISRYFDDENTHRLLRNYAVTINILMDSVFSSLAKRQNDKNRHIHGRIDQFLSFEQRQLTLSQKSILLINSLPSVSSTLVGMRNDEYVEDVIGSIKAGLIEDPVKFWGKDFINS